METIIFKMSYSQMPDGSSKSNLGDLLRSSIILSCLDTTAYWVTDVIGRQVLSWFIPEEQIFTIEAPAPSLQTVKRIFLLDNFLPPDEYRYLLKFECRGFLPGSCGGVHPANDFMAATEPYKHAFSSISWQESLVRGCGFDWEGQDYPLPLFSEKTSATVGFNHHVHKDWQSKQWPELFWKELELLLTCESISWQQGLDNLTEYIRWISSNCVVVTCDSFGLHLASAFRKQVVVLAGATSCREYTYDRVHFLTGELRNCMPCNNPICNFPPSCMENINPIAVSRAVLRALKTSKLHRGPNK